MKHLLIFFAILCIAACNEPVATQQHIQHFHAPPAGTVLASDKMRIIEDELNELYYSISITTNENSSEGAYDLEATYGYKVAKSQLRYPKLDKQIFPAIRRDEDMRYSYIIGFRFEGETEFKDYARIATQRTGPNSGQIEMRFLKSYYMDSTDKK